jgi:hypothetical protein
MKIAATFKSFALSSALAVVLSVRADEMHTPGKGTAEPKGILAPLHKKYTTGSLSEAKSKLNYLKLRDGWAWVRDRGRRSACQAIVPCLRDAGWRSEVRGRTTKSDKRSEQVIAS